MTYYPPFYLNGVQVVVGSNPTAPTMKPPPPATTLQPFASSIPMARRRTVFDGWHKGIGMPSTTNTPEGCCRNHTLSSQFRHQRGTLNHYLYLVT